MVLSTEMQLLCQGRVAWIDQLLVKAETLDPCSVQSCASQGSREATKKTQAGNWVQHYSLGRCPQTRRNRGATTASCEVHR